MTSITKGMISKEDLKHWGGNSNKTFSRDTIAGGAESLRKFDWVGVDILMEYGGGDQFTSATINAALNAVGGDSCEFFFATGEWLISEDVTIPSNIYLNFPVGAKIQNSGSANFTHNGGTDAPFGYNPWIWNGGSGTLDKSGEQGIYHRMIRASNAWYFKIADVAQLMLTDGGLHPHTDNDVALGTSSKKYSDVKTNLVNGVGPLGLSTTAGVVRQSRLLIKNGTTGDSIKCQFISVFNGDDIAEQDDIAAGGGLTGGFTLSSSGGQLDIDENSLSGDCIAVLGVDMYSARAVWFR